MEFINQIWQYFQDGQWVGQITTFLIAALPVIIPIITTIKRWVENAKYGTKILSEKVEEIANKYIDISDKTTEKINQIQQALSTSEDNNKKLLAVIAIMATNSNLSSSAKSQITSLISTAQTVSDVSKTVDTANTQISTDKLEDTKKADLSALDTVSKTVKGDTDSEKGTTTVDLA